ncbi:MAG: MFS transporter, partial [Spirochaetia bacterium]|nr:MFS transporter [Spirochaetia bacterium]
TVVTIFKESMLQSSLSRRLILRWLATGVAVIFGLTVPFLRIELGLSNSMVVLYSVVLGLAVVAASYISRQFSDRLGSRPLVFISTLFSLFFFLLWALITPAVAPVWFFILGFFTNFFVALIALLVFRLVQQVMPDDDAVGFNSMANFVIAIVAFFVGIISGLLADSGDIARSIFILDGKVAGNSYTLVFLFAMALTAVEALVAARLQEVGAYSSQAAAAVVFSMHGLKAVSMIERLEKTTDPAKRRFLMHSLGSNYNNMATSEIRSILASPFSADKIEAVRALADRPRKALLDDLITVARDDDSYVQLDAIAALGAYKKDPKVKEVMLILLKHGRWSSVRSMASKTLARITDTTEYLPLINELSHTAKHIDEVIDYLIAKRHMDKDGAFYQEFFLSVEQGRSATFRQTRYAVIASFFKFGSPKLSALYEQLNSGNIKGFFPSFLTEARDLNQIDQNYDEVLSMFYNQKWTELRVFCLNILEDANLAFAPCLDNLKIGILKSREMDISLFDIHDALAGLYFSYSLGKNTRS